MQKKISGHSRKNFFRTYPAVPLGYFFRAYPAVPLKKIFWHSCCALIFFALTLLCHYPAFRYHLPCCAFMFLCTYPAVPLIFFFAHLLSEKKSRHSTESGKRKAGYGHLPCCGLNFFALTLLRPSAQKKKGTAG